MKIVFTVSTYWPKTDGVQSVTQYQAEGLAKLGHKVVVITSNFYGRFPAEEVRNNVRIIRLNAYNRNMFHFGEKRKFKYILLTELKNADIMINVCLESFAADWVLPFLSEIHCKKILQMHGMHNFKWNSVDKESLGSMIKKVLRNLRWGIFYYLNWKYIMQYNIVLHLHEKDYSYKYFQNHGFNRNKVVYNAIDDTFFHITEKNNIIISVATFHKRKNQLRALNLFYKSSVSDYTLILIGRPNNKYYKLLIEENEKLKKKYKRKNVKILCDVSREETIEYIQKSKIYIMTSTWEAFPISVIEAIAAGAAFVSTDVGILRYLPGGVVCRNDAEMIEQLERMASGEWKKLGNQGKIFAEMNLCTDKQVKNLEKILLEEES